MANKIYYKGKEYGGGGEVPPIEAEEKQVLQGDGKEWATGGVFFAEERGKTISEIYLEKDNALGTYISFEFDNNNSQITIGAPEISNLTQSSVVKADGLFTPENMSSKNLQEDTTYNVTNSKKYVSNLTKEYFTITNTGTSATISPVYDAITNKSKTYPTPGLRDVVFNADNAPLSAGCEYLISFEVDMLTIGKIIAKWQGYKVPVAKSKNSISIDTNTILWDYDEERKENVSGIYLYTKNNNKVSLESNFNGSTAHLSVSDNAKANLSDNASFAIMDNSQISFGDNAEVAMDGTAKILLHNNAILDMGGTNTVMTIPSNAWDGKTFPPLNPRGNDNNAGLPHLIIHQNAIIEADGAACMVLHQAPNVIFEGNGIFKVGGYSSNAYLTPEIYLESGLFRLGGYYSKDGIADKIEREPCVTIDVGQFHMQSNYDTTGDPFVTYNGGSTFIMNGGISSAEDETGYDYDPAFILSHDELFFDGVGSKGSTATKSNSGEVGYSLTMSTVSQNFCDQFSYFQETSTMPRARARLRGDVCVNIGTNSSDKKDSSKTYVNLQPQSGKSIMVNIKDNAKVDLKDDSVILMRTGGTQPSDSDKVIYPTGITGTNGPVISMVGQSAIMVEGSNTIEVNGTPSATSGEVAFRTTSPNANSSGYRSNRFVVRPQDRQLQRILKIAKQSNSSTPMYIQAPISKSASAEKGFEITEISIVSGGKETNLLTSENLNKLVTSTSSSQVLYFSLDSGYSLKTEDENCYIIRTYSGTTTKIAQIDISDSKVKVTPLADNLYSLNITLNFGLQALNDLDSSWKIRITSGDISLNKYTIGLKAQYNNLSSNIAITSINAMSVSQIIDSATTLSSLINDIMPNNNASYDYFIGMDYSNFVGGSSITIGADAALGALATNTPLLHLCDASQIRMWNSSSINLYNSSKIGMSNGSQISLVQGYIAIDTTQSLINLNAGGSSVRITPSITQISSSSNSISLSAGAIQIKAAESSSSYSNITITANSSLTLKNGAKISGTTTYQVSDTDKENPVTSFIFEGISDKEESVEFTLAELKALKESLSATTS